MAMKIRLEHHASTTACRMVVDGAVLIGGMRTYVARVERPETVVQGLAGEGDAK